MNPWVRATLRDFTGSVDLLVIGGGITGAGIAREAALAGLSVALVDAADFGAGTSSRSSRLVHGGLRYLEHGHLRLVFEAVRERAVLLRLAPHLVRPLPFVLPVYRGERVPRWKIAAGLAVYDLLAAGGNVSRHRTLGKRALLEREPLLRERGLRGGALYWDAQCDDARLVVATVRAAAQHGALVANYTGVSALVIGPDGRVKGARLRDMGSGEESDLRAAVVVNAAGPWVDAVRRLEDPRAAPILRLTRGSHLLVRRSRIGNRHAVLFTSPIDGRVMFVLPWTADWSYIGTTETDDVAGPDDLSPKPADLVYLLRSANALFPAARLGEPDIVSSWAGLRPLLADDHRKPATAISREHRIEEGVTGMITIAGGKLTTFRRMGRAVLRQVIDSLGRGGPALSPRSDTEPLPGGDAASLKGFHAPGIELGLPEATVARLVRYYGSETPGLYALCRERRELMEPVHPDHPAIAAEVIHVARREYARTVDDVLIRRTHVAHETADGGTAARDRVARLLSAELGHEVPPARDRSADRWA